jgi:hypothetical protein
MRLLRGLLPGLWDGLFVTMLRADCNHLGDLWKWAREAANFAAFLFYNSISGVSKWFSYLHHFKTPT